MNILNLVQGTNEWHEVRRKHFTASEAPAMMGESKYKSRSTLLHEKATGEIEEVTPQKKRLFDEGHDSEESARTLLESDLQNEFYPATGTLEVEGLPLLGSFDGLTMMEDVGFEHKLFNESLYQQALSGELEPHYYWQLEQLLLISGAEKMVFVCSDGTKDKWAQCDYTAVPGRKEELIKGWKQFHKDLASYVPVEHAEIKKAESKAVIPTLQFQITGSVSGSNLIQFQEDADFYLSQINIALQTDEDFGQAITDGKDCEAAEKALKTLKEKALAESADIAKVMSALDEYQEKFRQMRLKLGKLVKTEKETRKKQIIDVAAGKWQLLVKGFTADLNLMPPDEIYPDFTTACKGKKTLTSMQDAVDTELAQSEIKLDDTKELYAKNTACIDPSYMFLFNDLQTIINQPHEAFQAIARSRLSDFQEQQRKQREAEAQANQKNVELVVKESAHANPVPDELLQFEASNTRIQHHYEPLKTWPTEEQMRCNPMAKQLSRKLGEAENHILFLEKELTKARVA